MSRRCAGTPPAGSSAGSTHRARRVEGERRVGAVGSTGPTHLTVAVAMDRPHRSSDGRSAGQVPEGLAVSSINTRAAVGPSPLPEGAPGTLDAATASCQWSPPPGRTAPYGHNSAEDLPSVADVGGGVTTFTYSRANLLTGITDPLGRTLWTYADDAAGQLPSTTDPLGWMTMVTDTSFDERTAMTGPSGTTTTYTYNADGDLTHLARPLTGTSSSQTTALTYGNARQASRATSPR